MYIFSAIRHHYRSSLPQHSQTVSYPNTPFHWQIRQIQCRNQEQVEVYIFSAIRHHGAVFTKRTRTAFLLPVDNGFSNSRFTTPWQGHRMRVFENGVLRKPFAATKEEVPADWKCTMRSLMIGKGKSKVHRRTGHKGRGRNRSITLLFPLTSALYGGGWSTPRPGRFTPGK